jgi:hypothetical protein
VQLFASENGSLKKGMIDNSTTDFELWIDSNLHIADVVQVWEVYEVTSSRNGEQGSFSASKRGDMTFIKGDDTNHPQTLVLSSEKARKAFLAHLDYGYADQGGVYGAYQFERAMNKDD